MVSEIENYPRRGRGRWKEGEMSSIAISSRLRQFVNFRKFANTRGGGSMVVDAAVSFYTDVQNLHYP